MFTFCNIGLIVYMLCRRYLLMFTASNIGLIVYRLC